MPPSPDREDALSAPAPEQPAAARLAAQAPSYPPRASDELLPLVYEDFTLFFFNDTATTEIYT
jgi:hypothetical protein